MTLVFSLAVGSTWASPGVTKLKSSPLNQDDPGLRYTMPARLSFSTVKPAGPTLALLSTGSESDDGDEAVSAGRKSPFKAFVLSAVVPGAGQFYLGRRIKPLIFLAIEAGAWGLHFKYQGQGDDRTDVFEQFNRDHWHQSAYEDYLAWNYSGIRDDELINATEISHHLPDTRTQQYYEMTGKYNQFAWGWDDANYDGNFLYDYSQSNPPPRITNDSLTPVSARRLVYEGMRHDANQKYDRARRMIVVSIVNHLASAFEALFAAKGHNKNATDEGAIFSRLKVKASLKSYHTKRDTPFVRLSYRF